MQRTINFLKYGINTTIISFLLIISGYVYTFLNGGYNWGIDFSSGVNIHLTISKSEIKDNELKEILKRYYESFDVTRVVSSDESTFSAFSIVVKSNTTDYAFKNKVQKNIMDSLEKSFSANVEVLDSYFIDSSFSSTLRMKSILLVLGTFLLILIYVSLRFKLSYAIAAIFATIHDILFAISFIGVFRVEINSSIVVSILTIIGYSLNDTIIIFDRIRENVRKLTEHRLQYVMNISIMQTLSRTILTSLTTFIAVFSIYIFTEGTIKDFSLIFMVGVLIGTYSSIFVASPVLWYLYRNIK